MLVYEDSIWVPAEVVEVCSTGFASLALKSIGQLQEGHTRIFFWTEDKPTTHQQLQQNPYECF